MRTWLLTFLLMFLVSCAPMADRTPQPTNSGQPTATPTPPSPAQAG